MKFVGIREAQKQLSDLVKASQDERIVLTRHGRPVALLEGIDPDELERRMLASDPEFLKMIDERRKPGRRRIPHEVVKAEAKRALANEIASDPELMRLIEERKSKSAAG